MPVFSSLQTEAIAERPTLTAFIDRMAKRIAAVEARDARAEETG